MKRILSVLLAAALLTALFCGCNADASAMRKLNRELKGTSWNAVAAEDAIGGMIAEEELQKRMGGMHYEFLKNGKFESTTLGETLAGTWEVTAPDTVSITIGEAQLTAVKVEDTLELQYLGSTFTLVEEE